MNTNRRKFLKRAAISSSGLMSISTLLKAEDQARKEAMYDVEKRPKVLFFDVNETLLDLNAMKVSVGKALEGRSDLLPLWFATMLQYSLVATVGNHYDDFGVIGAAALRMVARNNGIELTEQQSKDAILGPIRSLPPHPEVKEALKLLKEEGFPLVSFTNSSYKGVEAQFKNAGLIDLFDERLSVEEIGKFKPHADAYAWAARKMGVKPNESFMIAAHGWDIAGAVWAGWRAGFISRPAQQLYPLAPPPEMNEHNLTVIAQKLVAMAK